jgi:6-phosphogluconolactonase (cycloisomerase 2 family)
MHRHLARRTLSVAALAVGLGTAFATTASAEGHHSPTPAGHVYEATNASNGNAIQVFDRGDDGRLTAGALVATGGLGDGASLHSQGGVVRQGNLLFAVNARSATVSALQITDHGLVLRDTVATLGTLPVSVTARDGVGYVVNQGSDTITGFRYASDGDLSPLPGSTRALTPNPAGGITDAAQIQFTPDGSALLVTEKASNTLDTFAVRGGYAGTAVPHASAGTTPYGFDLDARGHAIVSEAASGTASSYSVGRRGFGVISPAVSDTQAAACWLVVAHEYAYAVNAASGTVSSYGIAKDGSLTLKDAVAANTGAGGTDAALSADQRYLYVRMGGGVVSSWSVARDGSLAALGTTQGAPAFGTAGLAAS